MMESLRLQNAGNKGQNQWMEYLIDLAVYAYVLLFFYTAFSKIITYAAFLKVLSDLPMIGGIHQYVAGTVIGLEIGFGMLLVVPRSRITGLWLSLGLMLLFTVYLGYHVMVHSKLPCSCGGVISGMTWPMHVAFNIAFILLALSALWMNQKVK